VKYLLAIVNSKYAQSYLRANRRSNIHLYPNDWKQLPVPVTTNEKQDQVVGLVDQILQARKLNSIADVEKIERQIDELVYDLYGLTDAEIALIEGRPDDAAGVPPPAGDDPAAAAAPLLFTGQAPTGSFTERKAAVERLARDGTPAAAQHLAAALGDADAAIRFLAAAHLRRMGRPVAPVVRAFRDQTDDPTARREADGVLASTAEES